MAPPVKTAPFAGVSFEAWGQAPLFVRMHEAPRLRLVVEVAHVQPAGPSSLSTVTPPVVTRLITRAVGRRRAIGSA
jgi:hypothetical protein